MAIIPVLGVTAAIFAAIVAAVIGGFVLGVIFIIIGTFIIGTLMIRKSSRRKLGVGLRIFGYLAAVPAFILGVLLTGIIALFADLFTILIAIIVVRFLCRLIPDNNNVSHTPE